MTNKEEHPDEESELGEQRDSRLETFLRRASAIIAAEKGINNAAKAKLDELARHLHLPDELFEQGLQKLQASNSPVGNLTDYEKAFLKFLEREFSQKREGTVLSISIEEKAIAHARKRFGIAAHRAEQLIDYQAEESGIGRLSRSDAREFGRQMILDIVGQNLSLDDDQEKKAFRIGRRWGCDTDEVERLVADRLDENDRTRRKTQRRPMVLGVATMVGLIVAGFGGKWVNDNYDSLFEKPVVEKETEELPVIPEPNLEEAKTELELAFPDLAASVYSEDIGIRAGAMEAATDRLLGQQTRTEQELIALRTWFFQEPDKKVASRFAQTVEKAMRSEPKSNRNQALGLPYRASSLALEFHDSIAPDQSSSRRDLLAGVLEKVAGSSSSFEQKSLDLAIANRQWNELIDSSWTSPGRSSILVDPLSQLTSGKLPERDLQQYVSRSVRTIILADKTQWRNMQQPISSAISFADEVQRIEWIDLWLEDFDGSEGFREFTGKQLIDALGLKPEPSPRDYESSLKTARADWRNRRLKPALVRHEKIRDRVAQLKPYFDSAVEEKVNPDLIFQTALTANLCLEAMSITGSGRAGDDSAWSEVDAQLQRVDQRLREFVFLDEQAGNEDRVSSATFDTSSRDRDLLAFADLTEDNETKRLAAIERLPDHAKKFDAIPQSMASVLAEYVLSPLGADEWLQFQRVLPELTKWPNFVLTVADRLPNSDASEEQLRAMFTVLTGSPVDESEPNDWRQEMSLSLLKLTHQSLLSKDDVDANSVDSDWIRLEKFLQTAYWRRSAFFGNDKGRPNRSVVENAQHCVNAASGNSPATKRAVELIENATNNDLERVVLLNQMLTGGSSSMNSKSLGSRLFETELQLLQAWNQQREQQLKELIDGS